MAGGKPDSEIDTDEAKKIVQKLEDSVKALSEIRDALCTADNPSGNALGSPADVQNLCNITSAHLGNGIPACEQLGKHTMMSYEVLSKEYAAFAMSYEALVNGLKTMVENHQKGIDEQTSLINQRGSAAANAGPRPNTGNAGSF